MTSDSIHFVACLKSAKQTWCWIILSSDDYSDCTLCRKTRELLLNHAYRIAWQRWTVHKYQLHFQWCLFSTNVR